MLWIPATEAARRLGITRQALHKKLWVLEGEGIARRIGKRWYLYAPELMTAYDGLTQYRWDSPRFAG